MTPDSEEPRDTERKRRGEGESETAYRDLSELEKLEILKEIHDSPISGHAGINHIPQIEAIYKLAGYEK
jgi:hypothetical protein